MKAAIFLQTRVSRILKLANSASSDAFDFTSGGTCVVLNIESTNYAKIYLRKKSYVCHERFENLKLPGEGMPAKIHT